MNILYHRISGAVGLTAQESGTRGAWVEKRLNVLHWLLGRGHDITILSRLTKATRAAPPPEYRYSSVNASSVEWYSTPPGSQDLLVLEFGPSNGSWYKEDYEGTQHLLMRYAGPVVYLCDDPDLLKPSVCRYVPQDDWSRWTFLLNCERPGIAPQVLGAPAEATYDWFNPGVGMDLMEYAPAPHANYLVYPGRPGGRKAQVKAMIESEAVQIVSSPADWKAYNIEVTPSPSQATRRDFYRQYAGLICAFDETHARLSWRTGRAYHALAAGVPVLAFPGNSALWWAEEVSNKDEIATLWAVLSDGDEHRRKTALSQRNLVLHDETDLIAPSAAQALGL